MHVGVCVRVLGATVVVAGLVWHLGVRGGRRPVSGAVPLAHEVRDAQHGRVEDQVPPAGLGGPLGAGRVRTQSLAELHVEAIHGRRQVGGQRDEVGRALLDSALGGRYLALTWRGGTAEVLSAEGDHRRNCDSDNGPSNLRQCGRLR